MLSSEVNMNIWFVERFYVSSFFFFFFLEVLKSFYNYYMHSKFHKGHPIASSVILTTST